MSMLTVGLGSTTCLSGERTGAREERGRLKALARVSLAVLVLSTLTGCLVEDPPPLERPKQTPPRLDHQGARPFLDQIIIATGNKPILFSIPVTSEDAGEGLVGYLLLDYVSGDNFGSFMAVPSNLAPSTLDDGSVREFKFTWLVPKELDGCHRITLLAGHSSTLFDLTKITNTADLAVAYWWANVNPTPENANVLRDCPDASRPNAEGL